MSNVDLGILLNLVGGVNRYEMSGFGELIYDHPNRINLVGSQRKPTMKFMITSSHFQSGILNGCNNPPGFM
jgi:hypothetical protein